MEEKLLKIAQDCFGVEKLNPAKALCLSARDISKALEAAFVAGRQSVTGAEKTLATTFRFATTLF